MLAICRISAGRPARAHDDGDGGAELHGHAARRRVKGDAVAEDGHDVVAVAAAASARLISVRTHVARPMTMSDPPKTRIQIGTGVLERAGPDVRQISAERQPGTLQRRGP